MAVSFILKWRSGFTLSTEYQQNPFHFHLVDQSLPNNHPFHATKNEERSSLKNGCVKRDGLVYFALLAIKGPMLYKTYVERHARKVIERAR